MQRRDARHRAVRAAYDERGLLDIIPIVKDIPVVGDVVGDVDNVVNDLVGTKTTTTSTKTPDTPTPPTTTSKPPPDPTKPADPGGSNGGSSGGGGGGGGGDTNDPGDSGPGSDSGSNDPPSGSDDPSGNSGNHSPGGSNSSPNTPASGTPSSPTKAAGGHDSPPGGILAGNVASNPNDHPSGPTSFVVTGGKTVAVIGTVTYPDGLPTFAPDPNAPAETSAATSGRHKGISAPVLAAIGVVGGLLMIGLVLVFMRKRAINKRAERRKWWFSGSPGAWGGRNQRDSAQATSGSTPKTRSIRSSFGTNFDHSEFSITFDDNVPSLPPMVEIRGGPAIVPKGDSSMSGNGQPIAPISPISPTSPMLSMSPLFAVESPQVYSDASRRVSAGSTGSGQYLFVDPTQALAPPEVITPMSVRPFSPSESFAFPSPPVRSSHRSGEFASMQQQQQQQTVVPAIPMPNINVTESLVDTSYIENPFADAYSAHVASASDLLAAAALPPSRASGEFDAVETIWRPFERTLADEITVSAGDRVRVVGLFDDGWAMIEKVGMGKGKGRADDGENAIVGLVPIDCMRKAGQNVESFLTAKRVSSVNATGYTAMAV